jgi:hypothetical protein
VQLQRLPDGSPILRGRFHHDFLDLAFNEPVRERAQFRGARPHFQTLEAVIVIDFDVRHDDGQHLLVDVNSRDLVRHRPLLGGAESVPCRISQGRELSPALTKRSNDAQLFDQSRTLRIKQLLGLDGSTGSIRSHRSRQRHSDLHPIFMIFRGLQAQG